MALTTAQAISGKVQRYSREELLSLQTAPSTLITPTPAVSEFTPLREKNGSTERTGPAVEVRAGGRVRDWRQYAQAGQASRPNKQSPYGEAAETNSRSREVARREDSREGIRNQELRPAPVRNLNRPFVPDYYIGLEDATEATIKLHRNIEQLEDYLKLPHLPVDGAEKVLKILNKVLTCELQRECVLRILQAVCASRFLDLHLQTFIDHFQQSCKVRSQEARSELLQQTLKVLSSVCHRLPSERPKVCLLMTFLKSRSDVMEIITCTPGLAEEFDDLLAQSQKLLTSQTTTTATRYRRRRDIDDDERTPSEDFLDLPVFPNNQDLDISKTPFLRPSKKVGAFKDSHHYLDVQFRLLKEDFVCPLRNGISEARADDLSNPHLRNTDVRLYHNVRIIGIVPGDTLDYAVQFDVQPFRNVRWQSSKRLIFGSLVCLSYDKFDTTFFAVVTRREVKDLEKGIIWLHFETQTGEVIGLPPDLVFTMVESVSYFEANRHVLEGLQEMKDSVPMSRYIVECQTEVNPPRYLVPFRGRATMNLTALIGRDSCWKFDSVPVLDCDAWPCDADSNLNASQLESVKRALTKELAIIQGPPGTGKTHVGLKIAQVLLDNADVWDEDPSDRRPILVVCYTNHALDQFLEGIVKFCPDGIVRVGSRSQSEALSPFNISNIRKRIKAESATARTLSSIMFTCHSSMSEIGDKIRRTKARLTKTFTDVMKANDLQSHMLPAHHQTLISKSRSMGSSLMMNWLCGGMVVRNDFDRDSYGKLVQKVTSLILQGETFSSHDDLQSDIYLEEFYVRAQMYRSWLQKTKARLRHELEMAKKSRPNASARALEEWLEAADVDILPDYILEPDIDKGLFQAITCREDLPREICAPYCIRLWLGIDEVYNNFEDLEYIMNELQEAQALNGYCSSGGGSHGQEDVEPYPTCTAGSHNLNGATSGGQAEERESTRDAKELNIDEEAEFLQKQRMLDEDEDEDERAVPQMFVYEGMGDHDSDPDPDPESDEWTVSRRQKRRHFRKLLHLLKTLTPMSDEESAAVTDVWDLRLGVEERVRLYLSWLVKYRKQLTDDLVNLAYEYESTSRRLTELRLAKDGIILKKAKVIGMTTTAAARYRRLLETLCCPIVIMEEAAEVLEAHVVTTMSSACQHLILIGDHQQLRPSPTVYELCRLYNLDLSLFERLVNNGLPHITLRLQHRMRPEIARLVRHVYPHLQDHPQTSGRPHVRGVKHDVFFLHHEAEEDGDVDGKSKSNEHEAELCVALCRYLIQQGYDPSSITILVAYTGQLLTSRRFMMWDREFYSGVRVTSIDNYQGEENDIIILSLVRSNKEGKVGFLKTDNRVCVALSRARLGLYALGNFRMLAASSQLWHKIVGTAREHGQYGSVLPIRCENHPDKEILVSTAEDFKRSPEGGCMLPCGEEFACGHTCRLRCHGYDKQHAEYRCMERCPKILCENGHQCPQKCHETCQPCRTRVSKSIPGCNHAILIACSQDTTREMCQHRCEELLPCGHRCSGQCGTCDRKSKHECNEQVLRPWPCGHMVTSRCDVNPDETPCPAKCEKTLECGHACPGICGECLKTGFHATCNVKCPKPLPGCGHRCQHRCGVECLPCKQKCKMACKHAPCQEPCCVPCLPCQKPCPFGCPHKPCRAVCSEPCKPCAKACTRRLKCGHTCSGRCKETCFCHNCEQDNVVSWPPGAGSQTKAGHSGPMIKLPRCGHILAVEALDVYVDDKLKKMPHATCLPCPACKALIFAWDTWRYVERLTLHQENLREIKSLYKDKMPSPCTLTSVLKIRRFCTCGVIFDKEVLNEGKALAISRQIKLKKTLQKLTEHLDAFKYKNKTFSTHDSQTGLEGKIHAIQSSLQTFHTSMTRERYQELRGQVARAICFVYMLCARHVLKKAKTDGTLLSSIRESLVTLTSKQRRADMRRVRNVIAACQKNKLLVPEELITPDILDAPVDMGLCWPSGSYTTERGIQI